MKERRMAVLEQERVYKSRSKLLMRFFVKSRDQWKAKCREAKFQLKLAKNKIHAMQKSRAGWKAEAKRLAAKLQESQRLLEELKKTEAEPNCRLLPPATAALKEMPARHVYSVGIVDLFLKMVTKAAASLHSAAASLELFAPYLPHTSRTPCWTTGRWWLLRVGLYFLRMDQPRGDWIWMMDHTIQLGPWKCLVVVGIRHSAWVNDRRPLRHEDMTLLNLTPMEHSSGEQVHQQLQVVAEKTGVPCAILSDGGTDLKRSMELFHLDHPQVYHIRDVKHAHACLLKRELEHNSRWQSFVTKANQTKLGVTQTALAFLNPPSLKTKSRYMNLDTLVSWGTRVLAYLEHPRDFPGQKVDRRRLRMKLHWLCRYRRDLRDWSELLALAGAAEDYVHREGIHQQTGEAVKARLEPLVLTPAGRRFRDAQVRFLEEQAQPLQSGERMPGSTEVLESIIGKYKHLQNTHSKGGMTAMLLSIGAIVGKRTTAMTKDVLETIRTQDVIRWCHETFGMTIASQRRLALGATKTG
jgi:hypothetical protein